MISDAFSAFTNRIKNPISGSFTIIWIICNWKMLVYLFSSYDPESKIYNILQLFSWSRSFFIPLAFTVLYLIMIPVLSYIYKLFSDTIELWNFRLELKHKSDADNLEKYNIASNAEALLAITVFAGELRGKLDTYVRSLETAKLQNPHYFASYSQEIISDLKGIVNGSSDSIIASEKLKDTIINRRYNGPGKPMNDIVKDILRLGRNEN